ncbi:MAG: IgGFc-binding protein [Caldisericia bacterium]|nr:IgGFc-binding protein [Caldisericia bacterium]
MKFKKIIYNNIMLNYNKNVKKIIIIFILLNLIFVIPKIGYSEEKGYKKIITIKENGGILRNPNFIYLTIEDENLKKDSNFILIDSKTNKEIPVQLINQEDKKVKIRFELNLNKGEEKKLEFRFATKEKRTELENIYFSYPNFIGTEFYGISFEKIYIVGLKECDVKVITKDGKSLFEGKVKYGQFKRIDLSKPQIFYVKSTGPIMVISSSIGDTNINEPQDKSDDDLTYYIGSEGVIFTNKDMFISSFADNNKIYIEDAGGKLIYNGKIDKLNPLTFSFKYASVILFKSDYPVLIQYGNFDDSPFLPMISYKGNLNAFSFKDLTVFSPISDINYNINLIKSKKNLKGTINKSEIKEIETEIEGFDLNIQKLSYIYTFGTSSNFGGEQILSVTGIPNEKEFNFITGKISTKFSKGHKRVIYVLALEDDTEVNLIDYNNNKNQKVTLQKMSIFQYETEISKSQISIKSNKDVLVFESTNHLTREILFNISPVKDESILIDIGKTEPIGTGTTPPSKPETPTGKPPKVEIPEGLINIILWEITLLPLRFTNFINNLKIVSDLFKNIEFIKIALPKFSIKLPAFIDEILPPFLKGFNFFLLIILIILLLILIILLMRRKKIEKPKAQIEEIEEIEIPGVEKIKKEPKLEEVQQKQEQIEEIKLEKEEVIEIKPEEKEKETIEFKKDYEIKEESKFEETIPVISIPEKPKELIPKEIVSEKIIDTTILKGKVVIDRKTLLKIIELDLFPFLQEAYIDSKAVSDLPIKYRTSEKIKPVELTKYEESMAEDLGKRVGGSKETGEAIAIALRMKIDKCIVGEKFNRVFQNINIYSYEKLG